MSHILASDLVRMKFFVILAMQKSSRLDPLKRALLAVHRFPPAKAKKNCNIGKLANALKEKLRPKKTANGDG